MKVGQFVLACIADGLCRQPAGLELLEVSVVVFLLQGYLVSGQEVGTLGV